MRQRGSQPGTKNSMYLLRIEKFDYDKMMFRREEYVPLSVLFDDCLPDDTTINAETKDYLRYKLKNLADEYHDVYVNKEEIGAWYTLFGITKDVIRMMYKPLDKKNHSIKLLKV